MATDRFQTPLLSVRLEHFALFLCSLPLLSFLSCVVIALVWHFDETTNTHCNVSTYKLSFLSLVHSKLFAVLADYANYTVVEYNGKSSTSFQASNFASKILCWLTNYFSQWWNGYIRFVNVKVDVWTGVDKTWGRPYGLGHGVGHGLPCGLPYGLLYGLPVVRFCKTLTRHW